MAKKQKALINFSRNSDSDLETLAESIMQGMTGNASFASPTPTLEDVQALLNSYSTALVNAATRDRNKVAQKNSDRTALEASLTSLGSYVNAVCNGNVVMLTSSGFPVSKLPQPRHIPTPENVIIEQGQEAGTLISKVPAVKGATGYVHQITPHPLTPDSEWEQFATSRTKYIFENLEQGKKYWFRVAAIGSNDQVATSSEVSQFVMQRNSEAA